MLLKGSTGSQGQQQGTRNQVSLHPLDAVSSSSLDAMSSSLPPPLSSPLQEQEASSVDLVWLGVVLAGDGDAVPHLGMIILSMGMVMMMMVTVMQFHRRWSC